MKHSAHYKKYWTDKYITALLDAIGAAALLGLDDDKKRLFDISRAAMDLTSPAKRDTMQSKAAKSGIETEGKQMEKIKIWSVCVNHITWSHPQTLYFDSKQAAEECYNDFEYADKPQYVGTYSPEKVAAWIDSNPANVPPEIVLLYWHSMQEYKDYQ